VIAPSPTVSIGPVGPLTMDVSQVQVFTATASGGSGSYISYQWYVGGVAQSAQTTAIFSYSPGASGSYSITVTVTDSSGATSAQSTAALVRVNVAPTVVVSPGSATLDVGQSQLFTATASGDSGSYISYQWYVDGSAKSGQTASTFSFAPASAGSYSITVTVTDSLGSTSAQSSVAAVTASARSVFSAVDWSIVIIVIVIVLLLIMTAWYRHRKQRLKRANALKIVTARQFLARVEEGFWGFVFILSRLDSPPKLGRA